MPLRESESIVLKSYNLAEADRIVVFFTREFGMIRGVAKGSRRTKSKFGSSLEPFSEVSLEYFEKDDRELVSIQNADLIRSAFSTAAEPERLATYAYVAELLIAFAPPHDPNETLYRMVRACLDAEIRNRAQSAALRLYFEIWILRLGGVLPDWTNCGVCKRPFRDPESATLGAGYDLICGTCSRTSGKEMIAPLHRHLLLATKKLAPADYIEEADDQPVAVSELSSLMRRQISTVIGRSIEHQQFVSAFDA